MPIYQRGDVRIHYEEVGAGFPLLIIPGGGLNAMIPYVTVNGPFNVFEEFKDEYRVIAADLRNANGSESPARWRLTGHGTPTPTTSSG